MCLRLKNGLYICLKNVVDRIGHAFFAFIYLITDNCSKICQICDDTESAKRTTGYIFMLFCRLGIFSKSTFSKHSLSNTVRKSNSLDPDEAQRLQRLSADDTRRQRLHVYNVR